LVDADMRNPCIHSLFSVDNRVGLSAILSDRVGLNVIHRVPGLADLCILPAGAQPPNPSELLSRPYFRQLLLELGTQFDVILLDTPATGETSDAQAISVAAGGALIVVRKNAARVWRVKGVAEGATQSSAKLVGSVLNEY
jgi:receptor protein-tyrosine kinase